jgi:polyisoprenoid-binding protein YceI
MKKTIFLLLISAAAFASSLLVNWHPKDYAINFSTKMASGSISGLKGTINFDKDNPTASKFDVTVDLSTLDMGLGLKTKHAKAESFFHAEKYPNIHFKSEEVTKSGNEFITKGILTIKGISKPVTIPFTFTSQGDEATFKGDFKINRLDYDLKRKGVGEIVDIELNIPVIR